MFICLYGPDDYRRKEKERWYIAEYLKKHVGISLFHCDLEDKEGQAQFTEFVRGSSLFNTTKFIVTYNLFALDDKQLKAALLQVLNSKDIHVISADLAKKPLVKYAFAIKKPAIANEFPTLDGAEWNKFIVQKAAEMEIKLNPSQLGELNIVYKGNTWGLVTELMKLRDGSDDIAKSFGLSGNIWGYYSTLAKPGSAASKLSALEVLVAGQEPWAKIFNIVAAMASDPKVWARYDLLIKSGKLDYEEALVDFAISAAA